ncbi:MAG: hypothetical protein COB35_01375 [Gammaproteobacteria bacterium]|nr:MAG: hypothetical protein COB35_01375 [Gammaproteobacteria bacterium]
MIKRNLSLDLIRTLAIVLMVIFHFIYDLKYFGWVTWNTPDGNGWKHFRFVILSLFFICIGASLVYSHFHKFQLKKYNVRLLKVLIGAILITLMSLVMFPHNWIYFGVLHFIVVASLIAIIFIPHPHIALITGVVLIIGEQFGLLSKHWPFYYFNDLLPSYTTDYVPLFPWLGVILLGISLAHSQWFNTTFFTKTKFTNTKLLKKLTFVGKHSLLIYLLHQPLLFAILTPIHWWLN